MHPPVIQPRRSSNADSGGSPLPSSTLSGSLHYIPSLPMDHRPSFDPAEKDRNSGKVGKTFPPSTWRMDFPLPSQPIHLDQSSLTGQNDPPMISHSGSSHPSHLPNQHSGRRFSGPACLPSSSSAALSSRSGDPGPSSSNSTLSKGRRRPSVSTSSPYDVRAQEMLYEHETGFPGPGMERPRALRVVVPDSSSLNLDPGRDGHLGGSNYNAHYGSDHGHGHGYGHHHHHPSHPERTGRKPRSFSVSTIRPDPTSGSFSREVYKYPSNSSFASTITPSGASIAKRITSNSNASSSSQTLGHSPTNPLSHTWGGQTVTPLPQMNRGKGDDWKRGSLPPGALPAVTFYSPVVVPMGSGSVLKSSTNRGTGGEDEDWQPLREADVRVPRRTSSLSYRKKPARVHPHGIRRSVDLGDPGKGFDRANEGYEIIAPLGDGLVGVGRPLVSPGLALPLSRAGSRDVPVDFFTSKALGESSVLGLQDGLPLLTGIVGMDIVVDGYNGSNQSHGVGSSGENEPRGSFDEMLHMPSLTETSSGAGTVEGLLSSASTSLSRSTKNAGKETVEPIIAGQGAGKDESTMMDDLTKALNDKLTTRMRRSDRRKYQIVALVETEVAYTAQLRDLVEICLPQLAALACVSESDHAAIARNLGDMLYFHEQFSARMVEVLREERLGTESDLPTAVDEPARTERMIRKVSAVFVEDASGLEIYDKFCSGCATASDIIRKVENRPEWHAFERRCRIVSAMRSHKTLYQILQDESPNFDMQSVPPPTLSSSPSRLHLRDLLILPVQRICRYSLVLYTLTTPTSSTPSPSLEDKMEFFRCCDVGVDPSRALAVAKMAAARADEANRRSTTIARTNHIARRVEPHLIVTKSFIDGLGPCILAGGLDVLYHHKSLAPLQSPVKVKYMGAFLYRGFILFVKVKKTSYEVKHYLPLEMFEMIDVTEGFLTYSIRLTFLDHFFELATVCQEEKDVWATALCSAREEIGTSVLDLPCSVILGTARARRGSTMSIDKLVSPSKRNSLVMVESGEKSPEVLQSPLHESIRPDMDDIPEPQTPSTPMRQAALPTSSSMSLLLRRASPIHRMTIDGYLVYSEEISLARMLGEQRSGMVPATHTTPNLRNRLSLRDSGVLKRRRSYIDVRDEGHQRTISMPNSKEAAGSPVATVKRNSIAGSIKRGLSLSLYDSSPSSWNATPGSHTASTEVTRASNLPPAGGFAKLNDEPQPHRPVNMEHGSRPHVRSLSTGLDGALPIVKRKQSLTNIGSLFGRPKEDRSYSLPPSPSAHKASFADTRKPSQSPGLGYETDGYFAVSNAHSVYTSGAGYTNVPPALSPSSSGLLSMGFNRPARSKAPSVVTSEFGVVDSRRNSLDTETLMSSVFSTLSDIPVALQSVPGSPANSEERHQALPSILAESPTITSNLVLASQETATPGARPNNTPKRRRSARLFSTLKGFTSITGNGNNNPTL